MKTFQAIIGMVVLLIVSAQTFRHVYVRWVEPRASVLDRFEPTKQTIAASKSLDELLELYEPALSKVREADGQESEEEKRDYDYRRLEREPYKSEAQLKRAITEWEEHRMQLAELHFFWWAGAIAVALGGLAAWRSRPWLATTAVILGYSEMIWATCPSMSTFGFPVEFETLLTFKVIYSVVTLVLILLVWFGITSKPSKPGFAQVSNV